MCKLHESQNAKYLNTKYLNDNRRDTIKTITRYGKEDHHCVLFTDHEYTKMNRIFKKEKLEDVITVKFVGNSSWNGQEECF